MLLESASLADSVVAAVGDMAAAPADELAPLISAAAIGCRGSFDRLYQRTRRRLFGIVQRTVRDRCEAEEVLQEIYLKVWLECRSFDVARGHVNQWLGTIARNTAIDCLKRRESRPKWALPSASDEDGDPYASFASPDTGPAQCLMARRQSEELARCMRLLPSAQRETVVLAYYGELSHEEVAAELSRPLGTVKSWIRRSLISLRATIETDHLAKAPAPAPSVHCKAI